MDDKARLLFDYLWAATKVTLWPNQANKVAYQQAQKRLRSGARPKLAGMALRLIYDAHTHPMTRTEIRRRTRELAASWGQDLTNRREMREHGRRYAMRWAPRRGRWGWGQRWMGGRRARRKTFRQEVGK